jgi:hypothetical protein
MSLERIAIVSISPKSIPMECAPSNIVLYVVATEKLTAIHVLPEGLELHAGKMASVANNESID